MAAKPERISFVVQKGCLVPADRFASARLRAKAYRSGDLIAATLHKQRNVKFNRKAHLLGELLIQNVEAFERYTDPHKVLKRLQWEADIACETMAVNVPGLGLMEVRMPQSLSFEAMDEGAFEETYMLMCRHIVKTYWPTLKPEELEAMAEFMDTDRG